MSLLLYLVSCSDTFDKLKEFYKELLNLQNKVTKVDHAEKFRQIMYIPLTYLKDLSAIISRFSDVYDRVSNSKISEISKFSVQNVSRVNDFQDLFIESTDAS